MAEEAPSPILAQEHYDDLPYHIHSWESDRRWILWAFRKNRGDKTKYAKFPLVPVSREHAARWRTLPEVWRDYKKDYPRLGIGLILTDGPWLSMDFDHCRCAETGQMAQFIKDGVKYEKEHAARGGDIRACPYAEISISGTGAHIIGNMPMDREYSPLGKRYLWIDPMFPAMSVEIYTDSPRFFTLSGREL